MIPFECRPDQLNLMFDSVKECMDYYQRQQGTLTTISTAAISSTEKQITNLELGLSITIGIVGFFFMGLVVHFIKNQWDCKINCQFIPTINCPDNFLNRLELWMESCLSSNTESDEEYSVVTPDTPTSGSSTQTPTPPPNYETTVANVPPRAIAAVSPRRIAPVAPPRRSILAPEMQTPTHEPISPSFFTPAIDYDPDSSADSIHSIETPAPDVSEVSTPVASISSTDFPPRSLDMIMPTPMPPSHVGPRSLPSQYRTPAYQSQSIGNLTMDQSEDTSTPERSNRYDETSLIVINTEENDTATVRANSTTIDDDSSTPSPIIERGTLADLTINETTNQDTVFGVDESTATATGSNNENIEGTIEEVTEVTIEEVTEEAIEEAIDEAIEEVTEEVTEENVKDNYEGTIVGDQKTEDGKKTEDDRDSGENSDDSPTNSEYEREVRRQRRLTRLAKNLKSQVNYDNK